MVKCSRALEHYAKGKEECKRKFKTILEEGEYTAQQLIDALKYEVEQKIERSIRERKNLMSYMQGSIPYLNQRTFEGFIELMKQKTDEPSIPSGPTDI
jgi:dsDNA-specific endonuclease/ATPase MutS2